MVNCDDHKNLHRLRTYAVSLDSETLVLNSRGSETCCQPRYYITARVGSEFLLDKGQTEVLSFYNIVPTSSKPWSQKQNENQTFITFFLAQDKNYDTSKEYLHSKVSEVTKKKRKEEGMVTIFASFVVLVMKV